MPGIWSLIQKLFDCTKQPLEEVFVSLVDVKEKIVEPTVDEATIAEPAVEGPTVEGPTVAEPTVEGPTVAEPTVPEQESDTQEYGSDIELEEINASDDDEDEYYRI